MSLMTQIETISEKDLLDCQKWAAKLIFRMFTFSSESDPTCKAEFLGSAKTGYACFQLEHFRIQRSSNYGPGTSIENRSAQRYKFIFDGDHFYAELIIECRMDPPVEDEVYGTINEIICTDFDLAGDVSNFKQLVNYNIMRN